MDLSIILPTYNERKNIQVLIPQLEKLIKSKTRYSFEIIVVDDSSPDGTADAAKQLNKKYKNIRVLLRGKKEGLGAALIAGYNAAKGSRIMSMDSDLAFPLADVIKLLDKIDNGYDLVVGSRHGYKESVYEKANIKTMVKSKISYLGNCFTKYFLKVPINDFSLNFRVIKNSMWQKINVSEKRNTMLLETIFRTKQNNGRIAEVPVTFRDRTQGKSKMRLSREAPLFLRKVIEFGLRKRF